MNESERALHRGEMPSLGHPKVSTRSQVRGLDYDGPAWQQSLPSAVLCDHEHGDDTYLCPACAEHLRTLIEDVPALMADLEVALTKEVSFVQQGALVEADPEEATLPWNAGAAKLMRRLRQLFDGDPADRAQANLADWHAVLRRPDLPGWASSVSSAIAQAHRIIDRPPEVVYYGRCPLCSADIHQERVHPKDPDARITCPECTYSASLKEHQDSCLEAGEDQWLTIEEMAAAFTRKGEPLTRRQLQRLIDHGGLPRETRSRPVWRGGVLVAHEVAVYRVGDVRALQDQPGLLTTQAVAQVLGVGEPAVRKMVERGHLRPCRSGAKPLRFTSAEVRRVTSRKAA